MTARRMVSYTEHKLRTGNKMMSVRFYLAEGESYELLPLPKKDNKPTAKWTPTVPASPKAPVAKVEPAPAPANTVSIDHMTIGEARELYAQLKKLFG